MYAMQLPTEDSARAIRVRNVLGVGVSSWRLWRANFGYSGPFVRMSVVNSDDHHSGRSVKGSEPIMALLLQSKYTQAGRGRESRLDGGDATEDGRCDGESDRVLHSGFFCEKS